MPNFSTARDSVREANREVVGQTLTLFNQALALVAALAWNEAVKSVIDHYFPAKSGVYSKFVYAIILTLLVVVISRYLNRVKKRFQPSESA